MRFWKLFLGLPYFFALSAFSQPTQNISSHAPAAVQAQKGHNFIRIRHHDGQSFLETVVSHFSNEKGQKVSLIGAIHIADKSYYDEINQRFTKYDKVLYEMIGGEDLPAELREQKKLLAEGKKFKPREKKKINGFNISDIYFQVANKLGLVLQNDGVDYSKNNFVHADMTLKEFDDAQKKNKESLLTFMLQGALNNARGNAAQVQPNMMALIQALLTDNKMGMKRELMKVLEGSDLAGMMDKENVILHGRNDKCLSVLDKELKNGIKSAAIFYGAAHLEDLQEKLKARGFKLDNVEYLSAWKIEDEKK